MAVANGFVEPGELAFGVADAKVGEAPQIGPDVLLGGALLLAVADQESEDIVVELAGQFAVEVAEAKVLFVLGDGLGVGLAQPEALGQPEVGLRVARVQRDRFLRGGDGGPDRLVVGRRITTARNDASSNVGGSFNLKFPPTLEP